MKKFCIIVIWYGNLPDYFKYWERSASRNSKYADFLIVTDQQYYSEYENIHVLSISMKQLERRISTCLNINARLKKPFKACDFRPAFGLIFSQELRMYEYWGHCDFDQVFGDLGILVDRIKDCSYDKIGRSGHLTLYKNDDKINKLFMQEGALFEYRQVFETDENYAFDERTGICRISKRQKIHYLNIVGLRADISAKSRRMDINDAKNYNKQLFFWDDGHLFRAYLQDGKIVKEEYIYMHFQKKHPRPDQINQSNTFIIGKDCFEEINKQITIDDFEKYNSESSFLTRKVYLAQYYAHKLTQYFQCSHGQRKIWMAQKKIRHEIYE